MATMNEIEVMTKNFADLLDKLSAAAQHLEDEVEAVKRRYMVEIKGIARRLLERKAVLAAAIEESPDLFEKPKTITVHGITIGFRKQKGSITWDDDDVVVGLIKKRFPQKDWDIYIKKIEKPKKSGLETLEVRELKALGVEVTDSGEKVYIKPADSEIDKFIGKLLKEDEIREAKEAA